MREPKDNMTVVCLLASSIGVVIVTALSVKAINTAFDWAVALGFFADVILACTSLYYLALMFRWEKKSALSEDYESEDEEEYAPEVIEQRAQIVDPKVLPASKRVAELTEDGMRFFERLNFFIIRACDLGLSEARKELSQSEWEDFGPLLDRAGVTRNNGTKPRTLLVTTPDKAFSLLDEEVGYNIRLSLDNSRSYRHKDKNIKVFNQSPTVKAS